jgi:hypothetical protein
MLQIGDVGLSFTEQKSQLAIWAVMNMPILMSSDLRKLLLPENNLTLALLTNKRILALNQDVSACNLFIIISLILTRCVLLDRSCT